MAPDDLTGLGALALRPGPSESDLAECAREPIHRLGQIQPHGCLLLLSQDGATVRSVSANALEYLGHHAVGMLGRPVAQFLPAGLCRALQRVPLCNPAPVLLQTAQPQPDAEGWDALEVQAHRTDEGIVVELLRPTADLALRDRSMCLRTLQQALAAEDGNLFRAARHVADAVAEASGYDRVMVYRFQPDWSGEVIAETRLPHLVPYLGLRFPASDIPAQALALYRRSRLRVVADITDNPVAVLPADQPPDLGLATLRSLSPVHLAYLSNMGVRATLVASIMFNDQLWGLVACHHHEAFLPGHGMRETVAEMAEAMALPIRVGRQHEVDSITARIRSATHWLQTLGTSPAKLMLDLLVGPDSLPARCGADGVAWCRGSDVIAVGATPSLAWLRALPARHHSQADPPTDLEAPSLMGSTALGQTDPVDQVAPATGYLSAPLPDGSVLALFRREYVHDVHWGGEPVKAVQRSGDGRLMPRESFALWHETVRGTCLPWRNEQRGILALAANHLAGMVIPSDVIAAFAALGTAQNLAVRCLPELLLPHLAAAVTTSAEDDAPTLIVSDALLRLMSGEGAEIAGRPWNEVAAHLHIAAAFGRGGVLDETLDAWSPRGGLLHLHIRREPLLQLQAADGLRLSHWLVNVQDETHAHRVTGALQDASRRAEQAHQTRLAIMRNLNHEMRTPLNAILGFSELIGKLRATSTDAETMQGFGAEIHAAGHHLLQVIDGMLDLTRIESGSLHPDRVLFDLARCVRECCAMCAPEFDRKAIALSYVPPQHGVMVRADARMLRQVLINLLANAVKFTPPGGAVTCRLETSMGQAEISVIDNGPGIHPDSQRHIFEPLVQGDASVTRDQGGLGLGLFIGRSFMEALGGRLEVRSRPGMGATFTASLPLARPD
jgi:light-regulated signal transduction histidine kinase (bacteriophytochrome)